MFKIFLEFQKHFEKQTFKKKLFTPLFKPLISYILPNITFEGKPFIKKDFTYKPFIYYP